MRLVRRRVENEIRHMDDGFKNVATGPSPSAALQVVPFEGIDFSLSCSGGATQSIVVIYG